MHPLRHKDLTIWPVGDSQYFRFRKPCSLTMQVLRVISDGSISTACTGLGLAERRGLFSIFFLHFFSLVDDSSGHLGWSGLHNEF